MVASADSTFTTKMGSEAKSNGKLISVPEHPLVAALERADFKTVDFINQIFPDEASLVAVDPLIQKLRNRIRRVDAEILAAVRQQSSSGSKANEDLSAAMGAIQELSLKIQEIKVKAEQSEVMVQEICRDMKKLDFAKKNITTTITALNRLAMLVLAVERLQVLAANRQYREAAGQLEAVTQLSQHFEAYRDIPKIRTLNDQFGEMKATLRSHIFSDFSSLGSATLKDNGQEMQQLADACLVVDALEPAVKEELMRSVCSKELSAYQQIFQGTDVARLEKAERRYAWMKRQLKLNEDIWKIFPVSWGLQPLLCHQFCRITRAQLTQILDSAKEQPDVGTLISALERTLEFEEDLEERFGGGGDKEASGASVPPSPSPQPPLHLAPFRGSISSCFEPHLGVYVEGEERKLLEGLDQVMAEETWEAEEGSETHILASSTQMFLRIRKSFNLCSQMSRHQTLLSLHKVFQHVLCAYAAKLSGRLPKPGQGLVAAATGSDWQVKMTEKDQRAICYIINTAEYCHETVAQLAESIQNRIDPQLADSVDMTEEQDEFSGVITRALSVLVLGLETRFDTELQGMTRLQWATMESVGDQSEYVTAISSVVSSSIPLISTLLSQLYFQFFIDKLAASFAPRFTVNIFKCKRISDTGAQQMLLDTHGVKSILLELPTLGGQVVPPAYSNYIARELGKAEALLKVLPSPLETLAATYRALLPEGSSTDFQRILDLKGVKKADQQPLMDQLGRRAPSMQLASSPLLTPVPKSVALAMDPRTAEQPAAAAAGGMLASAASREAMMARAAALGRGAMAQSAAAAAAVSSTGALKRIFAMAESAKEGAAKKDITFRKLFST